MDERQLGDGDKSKVEGELLFISVGQDDDDKGSVMAFFQDHLLLLYI